MTPARVASAWLLLSLFGSRAGAAEPDPRTLAQQAQALLKTHCHRCHGQDGTNEGGFNYVLDVPQLTRRKKLVAGNPAKSRLLQRILDPESPMPPEDEKTRPSKDEIALLQRWIEAGAPDVRPDAPPRPFLSPADVVRLIRADLDQVHERDRRFTRYFTLVHLANAGLSDDQLQSYRHGLAKLVNSLSWGRRVVVPQPIDPGRTIFRIDLRAYQWNEKVWDEVLAQNPYGLTLATADGQAVAAATQSALPYVRADWFVAAAARPPLYHEVLQLPKTERELEQLLRVDVAENLRQERVARAGFNGSGVSRNNRLIERHESGAVVYWKSYDFSSNAGRHNLFAHPLGPGGGDGTFQHDGGEIIFNLPNGLQGYFLADGQGRRLDKGPTAIVSDPKRPDRAVENGLSCMSCHARGMIEKADQVRGHVLSNPGAFAAADVETVRALYPPGERFAALIREDARRFQAAVAQTGAPLSVTEPIAALALRFEAELDLPLAAAEAGVRSDEFVRMLERTPEMAKHLGPLRVAGGTVQRQVFVDAFADVVQALQVGQVLPARKAAYAQLLRRGDALLRDGDADAALRIYAEALRFDPDDPLAHIGRGDAHRLRRDLDQAIAAYTRALALDPRSALALNNRGLAFKQKGDADRALADFTAAVRVDPGLAVAYHNRGTVHHGQGDFVRAVADYTEALRLEPRSAVVYNNRGLAHHENGDYDQALADYDQALRLEPRLAVAYNNRGLTHHRKGDDRRAVADFSEAVRLDPKLAKAYFNRAAAYEKLGDKARAVADRTKALQLDPTLDQD
jgi:tetratricopeptide (TPR) repeat protein/mono/diheme cytochrome c family protein